MRIIGLGTDLVDIDRVERVLARYPRFAQRCFTPHEQAYAERFSNPARRYAARFAGKEAVMKALGTGYRKVRWRDVEITGGGKPVVNLTGAGAARAASLEVTRVEVTITHTDRQALVFAIALADGE